MPNPEDFFEEEDVIENSDLDVSSKLSELEQMLEEEKLSRKAAEIAAQANNKKEDVVEDVVKETSMKELLKTNEKTFDMSKADELTNAELIQVMADAVDKSTRSIKESASKEIKTDLNAITEAIKALQGNMFQISSAMAVKEARNEFSDFDDYKEDMVELSKQYPNMIINDLYVLAKAKKPGNSPSKAKINTERPGFQSSSRQASDTPPRRSTRKKSSTRNSESTSGVSNFRNFLSEGIDKVLGERGGDD